MVKSLRWQVATCEQFHKLLLSIIAAAEEVNRRGERFQTQFASQILSREEITVYCIDV
jgi:hypothetical protein